jgi:hypothetical protein
MRLLILTLGLALALSACGVKSQLTKPGPAPRSDERDPSLPPQPLSR